MANDKDVFFSQQAETETEEVQKVEAPDPVSGTIGGNDTRFDGSDIDPLTIFVTESRFGQGAWRDDVSGDFKALEKGITEYFNSNATPKGISNKVIPIDVNTLQYPICGLTTKIENSSDLLVFLYILRNDETGSVTLDSLQTALENKHLWAEDILGNTSIMAFLTEAISKRMVYSPENIRITGGVIVPTEAIQRATAELARTGYYCNVNAEVQSSPAHKQHLRAAVSELAQLNPVIRRSMIRINTVPEMLDYNPATWRIDINTSRPNKLSSARKTETSIYGYTDVMPGIIPTSTGVSVFGFVPTYILTHIQHDTKTPVLDRTVFAIAAAAEACASNWYRQSLVPLGAEAVNNPWALKRFVDPNHEYEQGQVPSIEPPENERARDMELDMLVHPRMFSVVMDIRVGDQQSWYADGIVGLASSNTNTRNYAEREIIDACDGLTNGLFSQKWNALPQRPRMAEMNMVPVGVLHMSNGEKQDIRTVTNLTYATYLASIAESGYDLLQMRQRLMQWADYSNADLRGDRNNLRAWQQAIAEFDPELIVTGWTYRISFNMTFIITLLQALTENGYRPTLEGVENSINMPSSLRGSIINNAGVLPPELVLTGGGYSTYGGYGMYAQPQNGYYGAPMPNQSVA